LTEPDRSPDEYFQRLTRLMDLEADAEKQELLTELQRRSPAEAEASGNSLIHLVVREENAGLGGRVLLTLGKRNQTIELPWTRLGTGTPVVLSEEAPTPPSAGWRGVVSRVNREGIEVALSQWPESESDRPAYRLDRSTDEVSRQRMRQALENSRLASNNRLADLRDVLLGKLPAAFHGSENFQPLNARLNASQVEAVRFALSAEDVAIIHGPPGTGKTTAVVELIRQLLRRGQRILVCAPSNLGVDNILERLVEVNEKVVRLGHPARVLPELREHTLDLLAESHPDVRLANKLVREAHALQRQAARFTRARPEPGEKQGLRQEAKQMLADARRIEEQVVEHILDSTPIVCATLTGLDRDMLGERRFDWCIVDEASQSTEPAEWIPLQFAGRLVLAGDHFQLPPTVISPEAAAKGFNISLLERLIAGQYETLARRLTVQYRMHRDIMQFSSGEFYEDSLVADPLVASHRLSDLPNVVESDLTRTPVHFIDTAGANYDESLDNDGESRLNVSEAELVILKVQSLLEAGLAPADIAVITPYAAQVKYLREHLKQPGIEIDTVDGFQGREKQTIIVSLVRSNREGEIGFLADVRRMNVALTRARRKLIVIGDSATVTSHTFYRRMIEYFEKIGAYHSIWEDEDFLKATYS
jgi:superfamily I DNA and/or RNA helicase